MFSTLRARIICRQVVRKMGQLAYPVQPTRLYAATSHRATQKRVAVLYQAIEPPVIKGVQKPMKPGGYQDSGADIAFALQSQPDIEVLTPVETPDSTTGVGWCFPDTEVGILSALEKGATHLWANTILFASHPLQNSQNVSEYQDKVYVVGQPPRMVELYDDKEYVNDLLRAQGCFSMPQSWTVDDKPDLQSRLSELHLPFPIVGKPIRGRGSHGVKVCHNPSSLLSHVTSLLQESPRIMLEEFLSGEEGTVTVIPPSSDHKDYWALPIVCRFNHDDGVAPYNGVVAVTANSRVVTDTEYEGNASYGAAARECEEVARFLRPTAPIRIDIRKYSEDEQSRFALFDINMKPNMTGPGRPGRQNQSSLTTMAAAQLGWDYPKFLSEMLNTAVKLRQLRELLPKKS